MYVVMLQNVKNENVAKMSYLAQNCRYFSLFVEWCSDSYTYDGDNKLIECMLNSFI